MELTTEPALGGNVPLRSANPSRGTNQSGVRAYNERLVLSLVRRHGALPKADIARLTGLSAMTTTTIMNRLEVDGLLTKQAKQRGRIGQVAMAYLSLDPRSGCRSTDRPTGGGHSVPASPTCSRKNGTWMRSWTNLKPP